jgi:hypothetical protein
MPTLPPASKSSAAAIFARLWDGKHGGLTPALARHVLKVRFSDADTARMRELARRNRDGTLTAAELAELDDFVIVGDLLAILQSKARQLLKRAPAARNGHG